MNTLTTSLSGLAVYENLIRIKIRIIRNICKMVIDMLKINKDGKQSEIIWDYEVNLFSTSPNSRQRTTALNADVPDCYTTL